MKRILRNRTVSLIILLGFFGINVPLLYAARDCQTVRKDLSKLKGLIERKNYLEVAVTICPDDPVIAYYYAYNFDRRQQFDKALELYKKAAALNEHYAKPYFGMGDVYLIKGQLDKAIEAYEKGLVIDPKNSWAKKQLDNIKRLAQANKIYNEKKALAENAGKQPSKPTLEPKLEPKLESKPAPEKSAELSQIARIDLSKLTDIVDEEKKAEEEDLDAKAAEILANAEFVSEKNRTRTGPVICKTDLSKIPSGKEKKEAKVQVPEKTEKVKNELVVPDNRLKTHFTIHFASDSSMLSEEAKRLLDNEVCKVMQHPSMKDAIFKIAGYADSAGSFDLNMSVSRFRAYVVKNYLMTHCNIPEERLYLLYFGETNPLVPNTTPENRYLNRRVEIDLLKE